MSLKCILPTCAFRNLLQQASLLCTWRECNPLKRNYTLYSYSHKSFSNIDRTLFPVTSSPILLGSPIQPIPWSDHCAVITTISSLIPQSTDSELGFVHVPGPNKDYWFNIQISLPFTQCYTWYIPRFHSVAPGLGVLMWSKLHYYLKCCIVFVFCFDTIIFFFQILQSRVLNTTRASLNLEFHIYTHTRQASRWPRSS